MFLSEQPTWCLISTTGRHFQMEIWTLFFPPSLESHWNELPYTEKAQMKDEQVGAGTWQDNTFETE